MPSPVHLFWFNIRLEGPGISASNVGPFQNKVTITWEGDSVVRGQQFGGQAQGTNSTFLERHHPSPVLSGSSCRVNWSFSFLSSLFFKGPSVSQPALLFHNSYIFSFFKTCQYLLAIVAAITAQPKGCHWQTKPLPPFLLAPATLPSNQLLLLSNPTTTIITHPKRQVLFPRSKLSVCSNSPAYSFTTFCAFPYHHLPTPLTSCSPFPHLKIIFKTLLRSSRG